MSKNNRNYKLVAQNEINSHGKKQQWEKSKLDQKQHFKASAKKTVTKSSQSKAISSLAINGREQSPRQLKVSQLINIALNDCLRKGKGLDARLFSMPLTLTRINVSGDLKIANCYFLPFNTKLSMDEILAALEKSRYFIRGYVTREVNLKFSPEIRFHYDCTFENVAKIEVLLNNI